MTAAFDMEDGQRYIDTTEAIEFCAGMGKLAPRDGAKLGIRLCEGPQCGLFSVSWSCD